MAARAKLISLDEWGTSLTVDIVADSWLDKGVSEWPDNVLFRVTDGTYARTMMNNGEAKVSPHLSLYIFSVHEGSLGNFWHIQ